MFPNQKIQNMFLAVTKQPYEWYCPSVCLSVTPFSQYSCHGPLARYVKLRVAHAPGMPGTFSLPRVSDTDMHMPWCMPGSLTSSFLWSQLRGKCSRHSWRMRNPHFTYLVWGPWYHHGVITTCKSDVHATGQGCIGQTNFVPISIFPDLNSTLNSQIATKFCTKVPLKMWPIVSRDHLSNFKVTWAKKLMFWNRFEQDY